MDKVNFESPVNIFLEKIGAWYEAGIGHLPNIIVAVAVVFLFFGFAIAVRSVVARTLKRTAANEAVIGLSKTFTFILVMALGTFAALGVMNLEKTVTSLLAGAGILGLALGFAFQEIAANFVSGVFIAFQQPYSIGDILEVDGIQGTVKDINLRTTSIETFDGLEVIIPNKKMFTDTLTNYTKTPKRRLGVDVGVSYGDDLESVENVTREALQEIEHRIPEIDTEFYYKEFGSSSINFEARLWVKYPGQQEYLKSRHEVIMKIKKAFDENDISIPYPIRTMDFGIKGGMNLEEPLKQFSKQQHQQH